MTLNRWFGVAENSVGPAVIHQWSLLDAVVIALPNCCDLSCCQPHNRWHCHRHRVRLRRHCAAIGRVSLCFGRVTNDAAIGLTVGERTCECVCVCCHVCAPTNNEKQIRMKLDSASRISKGHVSLDNNDTQCMARIPDIVCVGQQCIGCTRPDQAGGYDLWPLGTRFYAIHSDICLASTIAPLTNQINAKNLADNNNYITLHCVFF